MISRIHSGELSQNGEQNHHKTWSADQKCVRGITGQIDEGCKTRLEVRRHLTRLHVTGDVATWDILLSEELILDLRGAINLYIVKTGEAQVAPVAGLWRPGPIGQQRPQGRNKYTTSISPSPCLSVYSLSPTLSLHVLLRPTVCLPSPPSISITPLCSDLSQTQRGSLVYSHTERGGGHHLWF